MNKIKEYIKCIHNKNDNHKRMYRIPSAHWMVRDLPRSSQHPKEMFDRYVSDVYELLLIKLAQLKANPKPLEHEIQKIINLTNEFIKVKKILAGEDVNVV